MRRHHPVDQARQLRRLPAEWEPKPWPAELRRVLISRNEQDPDQVLTASFLDIGPEHFDQLRDHPALLGAEEDRLSRIADYEESARLQGDLRGRRGDHGTGLTRRRHDAAVVGRRAVEDPRRRPARSQISGVASGMK